MIRLLSSPMDRSASPFGAAGRNRPAQPQRGGGFALVVVLSFLVLATALVVAFLSWVLLQRQIGASSTSDKVTGLLAQTVADMAVEDLIREMEAGNAQESTVGAIRVFTPQMVTLETGNGQEPNVVSAPSMQPQSNVSGTFRSLIKASRRGVPFFSGGEGYAANDGPERAVAVATTDRSLESRTIPLESWRKPQLLTDSEFAQLTAPDWIYLDRAGRNPLDFSAASLAEMAKNAPDNEAFVIGRYAYLLYDVGGLIDINAVGNTLDAEENARRGRIHQVDLSPGIAAVDGGESPDPSGFASFAQFLNWRSPNTAGDATLLFDPRRDFSTVADGEQALVNRQDLIAFTSRAGSPLPPGALPYLTTFSRSLNAPHWRPDPDRPKNAADADTLNPSLLSARFAAQTTLERGDGAEVTVPEGTPVLFRKFPLGKLALLENGTASDADAIRYYFGLEKVAADGKGSWEYIAGVEEGGGRRIARLAEVAALGREPNFFEILQAVILTDSLGKSGGDAQSHTNDRDALRNLQVLQIGANIIDQWDADDIPTRVGWSANAPGLEVYGVENLPYINQIATVPWRPTYDRDRLQIWLLMDFWNPHQNAATPPQGIGQELQVTVTQANEFLPPAAVLRYWVNGALLSPATIGFDPSAAQRQQFWEEAQSKWPESFTLPAYLAPTESDPGYLEPREVAPGGGLPQEPASPSTPPPGLLLIDYDLRADLDGSGPRESSAAIPPKAQRNKAIQEAVSNLMFSKSDLRFEVAGAGGTAGYTSSNARGEWVYEAGKRIRNLNPAYWNCEPPLPPPDGDGWSEVVAPTTLYGNYPAKGYNHLQFNPGDLDIELKAYVPGENGGPGTWRTYQKIEAWAERAANRIDADQKFGTLTEITQVLNTTTHHTEAGADLSNEFHVWRKWFDTTPALETIEWGGVVQTLMRMDPRSSRFGMGVALIDGLGHTTRSTPSGWDRNTTNGTAWIIPRGKRQGATDANVPYEGFEHVTRVNNTAHHGSAVAGVVSNHPGLLNGSHPLRYADRDGVIRPGDGYFGALPTLAGRASERPLVLNRPFRSVGELGFAFRDLPWKTLDFATRYSADFGLLDVFSLDESPSEEPVVAGKVNLNSASAEVLATVLRNAAARLEETDPNGGLLLDAATAAKIAEEIVAARKGGGGQARPFSHASDLVTRVFHPASGGGPLAGTSKVEREAALRVLSEMGTTRTWNLMLDLVVQSGNFTPGSRTGANFHVKGQRRYWVHLAVDRITGEIIDLQRELVEE